MTHVCPRKRWSCELVEELLFLQCYKGEDVSSLLPPRVQLPEPSVEYTENYNNFVKMVKAGHTILAAQNGNNNNNSGNVSNNNGKYGPLTPMKGQGPQHFGAAPNSARKCPLPKTPKRRNNNNNNSGTDNNNNEGGMGSTTPTAKANGNDGTPPPKKERRVDPTAEKMVTAVPVPPPAEPTTLSVAEPKTPLSTKNNNTSTQQPPPRRGAVHASQQQQQNVAPTSTTTTEPLTKVEIFSSQRIPTNEEIRAQKKHSEAQRLAEVRIRTQSVIDPDLIFKQQTTDFPLHLMFAKYPAALKTVQGLRGISGDWRSDTFTAKEEKEYKEHQKYKYVGPSQCTPSSLF